MGLQSQQGAIRDDEAEAAQLHSSVSSDPGMLTTLCMSTFHFSVASLFMLVAEQ
jgi:hypothetical protein